MSRFSKAAAEKLGWAFTHESPEIELADSGPTGVTRTIPAKVTAEKFLSLPGREGHTVTETAETLGLLLERIHLFEQHLEARGLASGAPELTEKESLKRSEEAARVAGAEEELQIGEGHEAPKRRRGLRRRRSAK